jgi:signal transduction histidine kinase
VLTAVAVNEKPFASETSAPRLGALELPHDKNTLAIRFAALEYTQPISAYYSYKLEGFEDGWTKPNRVPEARYAGLPPGRYTFLLRVANADGVWGPRPLTLPIAILPPWWATWWARIGALLLLAGGVALGIRQYVASRVRQRLREIEKEKAVNDERLRISRDMHDELGSGLTKIALLSEVTKQKMSRAQDDRDTGMLEQITATSRRLTEKMGEIIWTLNPAADTLDNLAAYLQEYLSDLGDGLAVGIAVRMPENVPSTRLSNRQRQQILLVTKEAVNNAIKHAHASQITVSLVLAEGAAAFKVVDDGAGFISAEPSELAGKRNGLGNMVVRMKSIDGWCRIHTTPGGGTVVDYGIKL